MTDISHQYNPRNHLLFLLYIILFDTLSNIPLHTIHQSTSYSPTIWPTAFTPFSPSISSRPPTLPLHKTLAFHQESYCERLDSHLGAFPFSDSSPLSYQDIDNTEGVIHGKNETNITGGKINKVVVGPVWTTVTIRISSKHLRRKLKKK